MQHFNILTRRGFFEMAMKTGAAAALASLTDIPFVMKRALAETGIGRNNKKLFFIFLRGANDSLNSVIPINDDGYGPGIRPTLFIPKDPANDYSATGVPADFPVAGPNGATFAYQNALRLGNGFAALHPSLKFLAPVYNSGDLALVHRVGYPRQSRSHFDSQNYWENGSPNNNMAKDGIFYRTILESGLANTSPLTGVSIQSTLPLLLRGSRAAMTNLNDPTRYGLLGIPNTDPGNIKADAAVSEALGMQFPEKHNRELLRLQYKNLIETMTIFKEQMDFSEAGNTYTDDENTDGDYPYYLFPTTNAKNGGYAQHANNANKYVVDTGAYGFMGRLKAAAMILNNTDAIIAGTEIGGWDTHSNQGKVTGSHPNLQRRVAWAVYALKKYFTKYGNKCKWDDVVVVTLSEFGRTTKENSDAGTDHAEAGVMFVAGGGVKGFTPGARSGVIAAHPNDPVPWVTGTTEKVSTMFGASSRYLKRSVDYRSVLGEVIREHLGASQEQLNRIIPGYADESRERLRLGGVVNVREENNNTVIRGEVDVV